MDFISTLLGREKSLFAEDIANFSKNIREQIENRSFLVIGGAGTIGQAVVKEIFSHNPGRLHVVDISENNLVELVRDIRSSMGYIQGDFRTLPIDCGSVYFDAFVDGQEDYDYILNLSALKHVRSEKDPYTLMRLIEVNILNTIKTLSLATKQGAAKYFAVSTDKASNPVNMMGASKRIMEMFLFRDDVGIPVSTARFANVAFSDGSLLHGFNNRIQKRQPLSAPNDVQRYFISPKESGELCVLSCLLGANRDIFFPKLSEEHLDKFSDIAIKYLDSIGYEAFICESEEQARQEADQLIGQGKWPCYFFGSDTTGEKPVEEFYTEREELVLDQFSSIGIVKSAPILQRESLDKFIKEIISYQTSSPWKKEYLVDLFTAVAPEFQHLETGHNLDSRM